MGSSTALRLIPSEANGLGTVVRLYRSDFV
jgi:hypothetical protein